MTQKYTNTFDTTKDLMRKYSDIIAEAEEVVTEKKKSSLKESKKAIKESKQSFVVLDSSLKQKIGNLDGTEYEEGSDVVWSNNPKVTEKLKAFAQKNPTRLKASAVQADVPGQAQNTGFQSDVNLESKTAEKKKSPGKSKTGGRLDDLWRKHGEASATYDYYLNNESDDDRLINKYKNMMLEAEKECLQEFGPEACKAMKKHSDVMADTWYGHRDKMGAKRGAELRAAAGVNWDGDVSN